MNCFKPSENAASEIADHHRFGLETLFFQNPTSLFEMGSRWFKSGQGLKTMKSKRGRRPFAEFRHDLRGISEEVWLLFISFIPMLSGIPK